MKQFFSILIFCALPCFAFAQTDENGGIVDGTETIETFARDQLFGAWDWVAKTRQPNRGGAESYSKYPQGGELVRINFDRSGRVTVQRNGQVVNGATYSLVEDDARIVFGNWDSPEDFYVDEGPFDFDGNLLWVRGEYNDKGATWQFVQAGAQPYTQAEASSSNSATTAGTSSSSPAAKPLARPATAPRTVRKVVRKKRK